MSWTAPRTWVVGDLVTAAMMNANVRDNLLAIGPVLTCAQNVGTLTPGGTWGSISGCAIVVPATGLYNVLWGFDGHTSGTQSIFMAPSGAGAPSPGTAVVARLDNSASTENSSANVFIRPTISVVQFAPRMSLTGGQTLTFQMMGTGGTLAAAWGQIQGTV